MVKKTIKHIKFNKIHLKSRNEPVHVAYFLLDDRQIAMASVHLLAFKGNIKQRQDQLL